MWGSAQGYPGGHLIATGCIYWGAVGLSPYTSLDARDRIDAPCWTWRFPAGSRWGWGVLDAWTGIPDRLHASGLRWTPQRRILMDVLARTDGHVTGAELMDRCREVDPGTIPSTVYRTLDVLEELGVLRHSHGADGREEFHVLPAGARPPVLPPLWHASELAADDPAVMATTAAFDTERLRDRHLHLTLTGRCAACRATSEPPDA